MELTFVKQHSKLYKQAVELRVHALFKGMSNVRQLINDRFENDQSYYLVVLENEKVLAAGRLHFEDKSAVISQMAVSENYQKQGFGSLILEALIQKSKELECGSIVLSARESAVNFYKKHGFVPFGEKFPSSKTNVIHVKMKLNICQI